MVMVRAMTRPSSLLQAAGAVVPGHLGAGLVVRLEPRPCRLHLADLGKSLYQTAPQFPRL